jgi:hypothetical protein
MMVADEIRALLLIHDRLKAWEGAFVRDMAKLLEQRGFLTTKQLATVGGIMDRHCVSTAPAQAAPDQLTLLAEPVTHVVEAPRPTRLAQPVRSRVKRRQAARARASLRAQVLDEDAPFHDDPLPW